MFTGLITHVGTVHAIRDADRGREVVIAAGWNDLAVGESIAVDGACLTVDTIADGTFSVAAVGTTLARTHVGTWRTGRRVNLERALRATDRLGGHIVQGHVDGVGTVAAARMSDDGSAWLLDVALWDGVEGLCVPFGSIALDGVSLTVNTLATREVGVSVVPHTRAHTTLAERRVGDPVHVEFDVVGKYVRQLVGPWSAAIAAAP